MGKLIDDQELEQYRKSAYQLLVTSKKLREQLVTDKATRATLKATVKADIANDIFKRVDVIKLGQVLSAIEAANNMKTQYRAQLITLKPLVSDIDYQNEIQAEIDSLI